MMSLSGTRSEDLHGVEIGELQLALLRLEIEIGEHGDLDGAGLGEDFILVEEELVAGLEVFDGHAHHAVEMVVDIVNGGFEFLPEDFLFFGRGQRVCAMNCSAVWAKDDDGKQQHVQA